MGGGGGSEQLMLCLVIWYNNVMLTVLKANMSCGQQIFQPTKESD